MAGENCSKFYCENCGRWLGLFEDGASFDGIYPYCPSCKQNVSISKKRFTLTVNSYKSKSAEVPSN